MARSSLFKTIHIECPVCNMFHQVEERIRMSSTIIKGEKIFYEDHYFVCTNSNDENSVTEDMNSEKEKLSQNKKNREFKTENLNNTNQMLAGNAYRKAHNLLSSDEIVDIRENFGLTQVALARLLGWGDATVARYENKAIQDEAYDTMLRTIKENPLMAVRFLDKNGDKFPETKRMQIRTKMIEKLDSYGREFLSRQVLEGLYVKFSIPSDFNGYKILDIDKIERVVSYYAERMTELYKVRLMNMLWYADAMFFKTYGNSMTGMVYRHEMMGAFPIGYDSLICLKNINVRKVEDFTSTKYQFYPNSALDISELSKSETDLLNSVITKFRNFSDMNLVDYMREETAYEQTNQHDIIPYSLAKKIRS
ncbi:MAG: DUF4065 domain-containing protein [Lachnospiraceae bacterium]|nr:DUF4065 domain-containing protein [Lachnospiraceae bacterium]